MLYNRDITKTGFFFAPDDGNGGGDNGDDADATTTNTQDTGNSDDANGGGDTSVQLTQAQLDKMFAERADRASRSTLADLFRELGVEDVDSLKGRLTTLGELEADQLSEKERAEKELQDAKDKATAAEANLASANKALNDNRKRTAVLLEASKIGFADPDDAWSFVDADKLEVKDDGTVENAEAVIKELADEKPYLLSSTDGKTSSVGTPRKKPTPTKTDTGDGPKQPSREFKLNF